MTPFRSIPRRALALGAAIGIVIVGFSVQVVTNLRDESWYSAIRASTDVATSISHDVNRSLELYDLSLKSIVFDLSTAGVLELPVDVRDRVLFDSSTRAKYLGPIYVVDTHGLVYIDSMSRIPKVQSFQGWDFFDFHRSSTDDHLHIGHPFKDPEGKYRVTLSRRLTLADGSFAGVVVGTLELDYFVDLFSRIDIGKQSALSVALDDGTVLTRIPYRAGDVGRNLRGTYPFDEMIRRHQGTLRAHAALDGVERQYVFTHAGPYPILLTVAQSVDAIYGDWQGRAWLIAALTALLLAACGALGLILRRELIRRAAIESELFTQSERLAVTLGSIADAVLSADRDGNVLYMNPVAERLTGWSIAAARGRPLDAVLGIPSATPTLPPTRDFTLRNRSGEAFAVERSSAPLRDRDGVDVGSVMVLHDVTEARTMAREMAHLARHDALTNLPNRLLFQDRLAQAIDRTGRVACRVAVLYLDLDRFKHINDSLGHRAGDQLLVQMAARLVDCIRHTDTVSRQGGDEFVILLDALDPVDGRDEAARVAQAILDSLAAPFVIEGNRLNATASIGIATSGTDGDDVTTLIKNADAAMYAAKQSGRGAFRFFTTVIGQAADSHLDRERRIADGLARDQFFLHYQPLCDAVDGRVFGVEALVRWRRDGTLLMPAEFIAAAEESGQIVALGERVLSLACREGARWNEGRSEPIKVAVNVSAHQFRAGNFVERVARMLDETGLEPHCLELEITESVLLHSAERAEVVIGALKATGVTIALDDFGTGYSGLQYLSRFPVDRIKIDRSFVREMGEDRRSREIVHALVRLGRALGLRVIAEGVETAEQKAALVAMGCPELQGYFLGRPVPAEEITSALADALTTV